MAQYLYDDFILKLSERFNRRLEDIENDYNFELGDEFEFAICDILKDLLPSKFGVTRGFVVTKDGLKGGDDIIIYDRNKFPTLRNRDRNEYYRLENIPVEAVYAYIEAKNTIKYEFEKKDCVFFKAFEQATNVKKLIATRESSNILSFNPYFKESPFLTKEIKKSKLLPSINNPAFTCIVSRNFDFKSPTITTPDEFTVEFLIENILIPKQEIIPDIIVLNKDIVMYPRIFEDGQFKESVLFNHNEKDNLSYQIIVRKNIAYGIFLSHLLFALDWIKLGKMPWDLIHFDATRDK
ncbi:DUF6602 domain-containing protein [Flavobacterium sp.]|uniref:DUF6602 domain-containing protein n=1 Tax=Flavobacterium sp. TaxID=239 RepID=UPI000EEA9FEE|nr:DUF6602 domain-containing protein [Flavobacterium sp.]HCQ13811.1 hypothetical protein [Flavobacterium sp.]